MAQVISEALKKELDTILRSFLRGDKKNGTLFIDRYDIPHIVEVVGERITREMVVTRRGFSSPGFDQGHDSEHDLALRPGLNRRNE